MIVPLLLDRGFPDLVVGGCSAASMGARDGGRALQLEAAAVEARFGVAVSGVAQEGVGVVRAAEGAWTAIRTVVSSARACVVNHCYVDDRHREEAPFPTPPAFRASQPSAGAITAVAMLGGSSARAARREQLSDRAGIVDGCSPVRAGPRGTKPRTGPP